MTGILIALVITTLIPLFVATWRTSVLGLAVQGGLISWLVLRNETAVHFDSALAFVDLVVLRTALVPLVLYRAQRRLKAPPRNDVIAPNLVSWALAISLVIVAFRAGDALVPREGDEQMLVAVSAVAFALGLFVLAMSRGTFSQVVGILRIENAIAIFELGGERHDAPIRVGMTSILLVSILFYRWYLESVPAEDDSSPVKESPAL